MKSIHNRLDKFKYRRVVYNYKNLIALNFTKDQIEVMQYEDVFTIKFTSTWV